MIDVERAELNAELTEAEFAERLAGWVEPEPRYRRGVLANYATLVVVGLGRRRDALAVRDGRRPFGGHCRLLLYFVK